MQRSHTEDDAAKVIHGDANDHNLVVGPFHSYRSIGGTVLGAVNSIENEYATVLGGTENVVSGYASTIQGGTRKGAPNRKFPETRITRLPVGLVKPPSEDREAWRANPPPRRNIIST